MAEERYFTISARRESGRSWLLMIARHCSRPLQGKGISMMMASNEMP